MAENSQIEWTTHTFNPWIGCTKISPGCDHCYAETWDTRGLQGQASRWGSHADRTRTSHANWRKPLAWDKALAGTGRRDRVFCASLADVFDNHGSITSGWHGDLWHLIARTPNLDWLLLTKRPQNIFKMLPESYGAPAWGDGWPNVWLGTTAENQEEWDRRWPVLARIPAKVRFISAEPLLGPINMHGPGKPDWVIVGGESGKNARPMHPDWARSLRDQCNAAGVAFFLKQWGEWSPCTWDSTEPDYGDGYAAYPMDGCCDPDAHTGNQPTRFWHDGRWAYWTDLPDNIQTIGARKVGKKAAGRLLDGREWNQMPGGVK